MHPSIGHTFAIKTLVVGVALAFATTATAREEFDELKVLIEINATDGDVGFHALADAGAWRWFSMDDPSGNPIIAIRALHGLRTQGLTESFFESAEPLCAPDEEEPEELVVPLAEFISRFSDGIYTFRANNNEGDRVFGEAELTYDIPAAPDIEMTEDAEFPLDDVVISWSQGDDLGESCSDESLVADGTIADPSQVEISHWEVVVEVDIEDQDDIPDLVFKTQLPPDQTSVTVPVEYLQAFIDVGISEFKFEVGAAEASGNQTFSEGEFTVTE